MNRDKIKEIFLAHGFTIKEGMDDLKPYVYEAAEALLDAAAHQQQEPVTWRVAEFWSSANPDKKCLMLAKDEQELSTWGQRSDFIRWCSPAVESPSLAVRDVVDEVSEREAFEAMVKERFITTEHSLARAHPYGYYNTVSSNTFGGRKQPEYANVQMLWDVWAARAAMKGKSA